MTTRLLTGTRLTTGSSKKVRRALTSALVSALPLLLGLSVLAVIAVGARRSPKSPARRSFGYALIAVPLPLAVALHLFVWPGSALDRITFVLGVVAFGAGALLVLSGDDEDEPELPDDPDPAPWWPDFERAFRRYARTARVPTRVQTR
jgi:hypothetical protein